MQCTGHSNVDHGEFRRAMRQVASTVFIVSTAAAGVRHGMTATAATSLSFDPPSVLICVNRSARVHRAIMTARRFCLNVVAHDQSDVAQAFASSARGEERFAAGCWSAHIGVPFLSDGVAAIFCDLAEHTDFGTHTILIGRVTEAKLNGSTPLIYRDGAYQSYFGQG